jgi:two-component system NarL family response regulator
MKKLRPIRVLCVDDHPIVREGLAAVIGTEPGLILVGEASDGLTAIEECRRQNPDVVVMDVRMPVLDGVEATIRIRKEFPSVRVIVLTSYDGDEDIHRALVAGAHAYLLKAMVRRELIQTIHDVQSGLRRLPPPVVARLGERALRASLSAREVEVLRQAAKGLSNKEIGAVLEIAEDTVKVHMGHIFEKLQVIDRTQAVITAAQRGIIHFDGVP